jgi:Na+/melibiose symporter-like transporter
LQLLIHGQNDRIPGKVFCQRTIIATSVMVFFFMAVHFTTAYFLPEWFQVVKGANPERSGIMLLPVTISQIVAAYISGGLVTKLGFPNPFMLIGTCLQAIGTGLITTLHTDASHRYWIGYQVIIGLGTGLAMVTVRCLVASK